MWSDVLPKILAGAMLLVTGGGGVAWFQAIKSDKRESRKSDRDDTKGKVDIIAQLLGQVGELQGKVSTMLEQSLSAREDAAHARAESVWLRGIVSSFIRPVVEWLDGGAKPPPPTVSAEVRRVLAELADVTDHPPA